MTMYLCSLRPSLDILLSFTRRNSYKKVERTRNRKPCKKRKWNNREIGGWHTGKHIITCNVQPWCLVERLYLVFYFPLKSKMATKSGENWNFSLLHRIPLCYPVGQKFTRNGSISFGFPDIYTFLLSVKIQDGCKKWQKMKLFIFCTGYSCNSLWVKNLLETLSEIFTIFFIFH